LLRFTRVVSKVVTSSDELVELRSPRTSGF
jgi:hypothetical protein